MEDILEKKCLSCLNTILWNHDKIACTIMMSVMHMTFTLRGNVFSTLAEQELFYDRRGAQT